MIKRGNNLKKPESIPISIAMELTDMPRSFFMKLINEIVIPAHKEGGLWMLNTKSFEEFCHVKVPMEYWEEE